MPMCENRLGKSDASHFQRQTMALVNGHAERGTDGNWSAFRNTWQALSRRDRSEEEDKGDRRHHGERKNRGRERERERASKGKESGSLKKETDL